MRTRSRCAVRAGGDGWQRAEGYCELKRGKDVEGIEGVWRGEVWRREESPRGFTPPVITLRCSPDDALSETLKWLGAAREVLQV